MTEGGAVLAALAAAALLLAPDRRWLLAGLALAGAALAALVIGEGPVGRFDSLPGGAAGVAVIGGAMVVLGAAAALLVRWPGAVAPLLLVAAPLRLPLEASAGNALLLGFAGTGGLGRLYPFYAVLAAAALALTWRLLRGERPVRLPRELSVPAAALVALVALSLLWSRDPSAGADQLIFFWLPFTVLVPVVACSPISGRALATTLVGVAAAFAAFGLWQAATEDLLFFTVALERANELGPFRVTSAFQDPNHFGRFLVLAIAVVLVAAWTRAIAAPAAVALSALLGAALYFTYSQSSMVALVVVALGIALLAGDRPARRIAAGAGAALVVAGAVGLALTISRGDVESVTSDRSTLVADTGGVFVRHPVAGVGVGAQPRATREEAAPRTPTIQNASHTTPLTVAAELGLLGLAAFAALLVGSGLVLARLGRTDLALALGLAAVLLALLVHSLFYGGLFENPLTFGALGAAAGALAASTDRGRARSATRPAPPGAVP